MPAQAFFPRFIVIAPSHETAPHPLPRPVLPGSGAFHSLFPHLLCISFQDGDAAASYPVLLPSKQAVPPAAGLPPHGFLPTGFLTHGPLSAIFRLLQLLAVRLKLFHQKLHDLVFRQQSLKPIRQFGEQKARDAEPLIKGSLCHLVTQGLVHHPVQDSFHLVLILVFIVKLQVIGKVLCNPGVLDILSDYIPVRPLAQLLIDQD